MDSTAAAGVSRIRTYLTSTLEKMGIEAEVEERSLPDFSVPYFNIMTVDARILIGARARNLAALEYLVRRLVERGEPEAGRGFFLDVNGYRVRSLEELKVEAKAVARKVRLYRTELTMKPMTPFERRIIHIALAEYPDITTQSIGEDPSRRVVVKPYP